jgi:P4 family phage/plasmid primase-like protien
MQKQSEAARLSMRRFIVELFGAATEFPVFFCSLPNERKLVTREFEKIERFVEAVMLPERGTYFCVGTIEGDRRLKTAVRETVGLHADIDFKNVLATENEIWAAIKRLPWQPTVIVRSGHGLHLYWLFNEGLETQGSIDRIELALRQLADIIAGDPAVCEVARLMRLPGTYNTKGGDWVEVTVEHTGGPRYELDDLEDWLTGSAPLLHRRPPQVLSGSQPAPTNVTADNEFLKAARALGYKPPVDVEARLAAMELGGPGETSIHNTQLSVSASMLSAGVDEDEVVAVLLEATAHAAGAYGANWNWRKEEKALHQMCKTWLVKHPPKPEVVSRSEPRPAVDSGDNGDNVTDLAVARAKRKEVKPKPADKKEAAFVVADGVIATLRAANEDIMLAEGEVWLYGDGIWRVMTPADEQRLLVLVQTGFEALNVLPRSPQLSLAMRRLKEHPGLYVTKVPWTRPGSLVCQNGVLDIETSEFSPHSPQRYARRKIGAPYDREVRCPKTLALLASLFKGRDDADALLDLLQEWTGAALAIENLSREERRALILVGASRVGKTEFSKIFSLLIGEPIAAPSIADVGDKFGLATLRGAAAWVRDDAINEGDYIDPQRFKTIITGEAIDVALKNRDNAQGVKMTIPVCLTANTLPRARDLSDAIYNRSLVIELLNVVSVGEAHALRGAEGVPHGKTIGEHYWETEAGGVLNWALEGLRRLWKRGHYEVPASVASTIRQFKDDNNPVASWVREAVEKAPLGKVSRADILCAYHGWQKEEEGDEAKALGARAFWPRLRALAPWLKETTDSHGLRFMLGLRLTEFGLRYWDQHNQGTQLRGGSRGSSLAKNEVNKTWLEANVADTGREPSGMSSKPKF